jgi:YidC/Oxa1 family membrane protein insertase
MTDMRRTLLWVVFTMSLVCCCGTPGTATPASRTFFGAVAPGRHRRRHPRGGAAGQRPRAPPPGVPTPAAPAAALPAGALPSAAGAAAVVQRELVTLTTDLVQGHASTASAARLVRLELLAHRDHGDRSRNVRAVQDGSAQQPRRLYLARPA